MLPVKGVEQDADSDDDDNNMTDIFQKLIIKILI